MATPEGLEPPAYWFEANRSIHLSYGVVLPILSLRLSRLAPALGLTIWSVASRASCLAGLLSFELLLQLSDFRTRPQDSIRGHAYPAPA